MNSSPKQVSPILLMVAALTLVAGVIVMVASLANRGNPVTTSGVIVDDSLIFDGITEVEPKSIADFTLTSTTGEAVSFSSFNGKYKLIYFGYTFCPDFCPTTMIDYKQIKTLLGDQADQVVFMMISVDGERDTPDVLSTFLGQIDPTFVGLTGTDEEVSAVTTQFDVAFTANKQANNPNYTVDHTVSIFLVNPEGNYTTKYAYATDTGVIVEDLLAKMG